MLCYPSHSQKLGNLFEASVDSQNLPLDNSNKKAIEHDVFWRYFIKRCFIMKAVAAFKFGTTTIENLHQEKINEINIVNRFKTRRYSNEKIKIILNIHRCNVSLAKHIQASCWNEWENIPHSLINRLAINFARDVIDDSPKEISLQSIRIYINQITNDMLDALEITKYIPGTSEITESIINTFLKINRQHLKQSIAKLKKETLQYWKNF